MANQTKKKLQDEELDKVTGGAAAVTDPNIVQSNICPNCKSKNVTSETTGSGCDKTTTHTCKDCGHTW